VPLADFVADLRRRVEARELWPYAEGDEAKTGDTEAGAAAS